LPQIGRPAALIDEIRLELKAHFDRPRELTASPIYERILANVDVVDKLRKKGVPWPAVVKEVFPRAPRPTSSWFRRLYLAAKNDPGEGGKSPPQQTKKRRKKGS
jgi:hypothetical protein